MRDKRGSWHLLTGSIIGILVGLVISFLLIPVSYTDTEPYSLRAADRDIYRGLIARAFLVEADTARALSRLALLRDVDQANALVEQAQRRLTVVGYESEARALALLAAAVNQPLIRITALPMKNNPVIFEATPTINVISTATTEPRTPTPYITITPRPSPTMQPTKGPPYELVEQLVICEPDMDKSLIQVFVSDAQGNPVPGVRIEISLPGGGTETFYTGFYVEVNPGYADYIMLEGMTYNLRVGEEGLPVQNLSIPTCEGEDGTPFFGSLRLNYQPPE